MHTMQFMERVLPPDTLRLARTCLGHIFRRAAPRPIRPVPHVAVAHGIMMNIIQRRPVMPIRTHHALDSTEENFSPAMMFFGVPSVRSAAEKPPQLIDQTFDVCLLNEHLVMIRQHTPCK